MANTSVLLGFKPKNVDGAKANDYFVTATETLKQSDVCYMASTGLTTATAGVIQGIAAGPQWDPDTGLVKATAEAGDKIKIWDDPWEIFIGQITTYAATDPYTTRASAACYDNAGSAGAQYINKAASTNDIWKILKLSDEYDTGKQSAVGAYAKVECQLNPDKHFRSLVS
jgi:hypothetical protein